MEKKTCTQCNANFSITDRDLEFYEKVSPVFNWEKYSIITPKLCPDCRQQRRLAFRNERSLYKRRCSASGEDIISMYSPDKPFTVYNPDFWIEDKWDAIDHWVDIDFELSFLEQFKTLFKNVPLKSLVSEYNEWCIYTNICWYCKDCYLTVGSEYTENSCYGTLIQKSSHILDSNYTYECENCYSCLDIEKCFHCYYLKNSSNCSYCYSSSNLVNCHYCIECENLSNKKYCIKNKQVTKEEFEEYLQNHSYHFHKNNIVKYINGHSSENASWDYILNSKDIRNSFEINDGENISHSQIVMWWKDLYDCSNCYIDCQKSYEIMSSLTTNNNIFSAFIYNCNNTIYSLNCNDCSNILLCTGLKNKEYCILNKQYTKEEYEKLTPKIIDHMRQDWEYWEFFPISLSPFGYNETLANEYFPISEKQAKEKWFNWSDYQAPFPQVKKVLSADKLPEKIEDIPDDILNWAIECEVTKKPFRIIPQELKFYRKHNLPIPKRHPDQRHLDRVQLRNPRKLYDRNCDKCKMGIETTYNPEWKETVYCEACYKKEIY